MSVQTSYTGKAGHFLVMSEFLMRGWNVAIPEVDRGDDIFVVKDDDGDMKRVQVKTANANRTLRGYSTQFNVPKKQLNTQFTPDLTYCFVVRIGNKWKHIIVIDRDKLNSEHLTNNVGSPTSKSVIFTFILKNKKLTCSNINFTTSISDFSNFPIILH